MKPQNKYKTVFLISLSPYVLWIILYLLNIILGIIGILFYPLKIFLIIQAFLPACITYQIIYLLKLRKLHVEKPTESEAEPILKNEPPLKEKKSKILLVIIAKIFLSLSFFPYFFIILAAVISVFNGIRTFAIMGAGTTVYGMEAFLEALFQFTFMLIVIPIIPICFTYQFVYLMINLGRKKSKKENTHT